MSEGGGKKLRLAFMGTPDFAVPTLEALHRAGHQIKAVYCQKPKPSKRGLLLGLTPVHRAASRLGLEVRCPERLRQNQAELDYFAGLALDAAIIVAYGLILPPEFLAVPRRGCLNIHASLLPRWRGAAPIQAALLAGDAETGITIMQMDAGLDTGPMLLEAAIPIGDTDTAASLHDRLAPLGAELMLRVLAGSFEARAQEGASCYAPKLSRDDAMIDWSAPAVAVERRVRAFTPWPGSAFLHRGEKIKIHAAALVAADGVSAPAGTVLDDRLSVACGAGVVRLSLVQRASRSPLEAAEFLRGYPIPAGTVLG